jgi:hypothetical protein
MQALVSIVDREDDAHYEALRGDSIGSATAASCREKGRSPDKSSKEQRPA